MTNLWDPDLYAKAWDFASLAHDGQTYGSSEKDKRVPYINHIGNVAMEVMLALNVSEESYDANLALQCALLHDVVEDTEYTRDDIEAQFGAQVAQGVAALSKDESIQNKRDKMQDSLDRIKCLPTEIGMVKLADRITNLSEPPFYWTPEKILDYCEEAKMIYNDLSQCNSHLARRLQSKIDYYPTYAKKRADETKAASA